MRNDKGGVWRSVKRRRDGVVLYDNGYWKEKKRKFLDKYFFSSFYNHKITLLFHKEKF